MRTIFGIRVSRALTLLPVVLLVAILFNSCTDDTQTAIKQADIYMVGYNASVNECYVWKNGEATTLTFNNPITPSNICVKDEEVLIAGTENSTDYSRAILIRDGVVEYLSDTSHSSSTLSMCLENEDLYILYTESEGMAYRDLKLWHNGEVSTMNYENKLFYFTGMVVENGDIYISGVATDDSHIYHLFCWKNGDIMELSTASDLLSLSICVSDGDLYYLLSSTSSFPTLYKMVIN